MFASIENSKVMLTIKKYRKIIDIALYSLIFLSLFLACFFESFAYVSAALICLTSLLFFNIEKNLSLLLILNCYNLLFKSNIHSLASYVSLFVSFITCLPYLISVIKRQKKLNFKLLIPIALFFIYIVLPIHKISLPRLINLLKIYGLMYVVYESRKEINISFLIKFFSISLIIACFFEMFRNVSARLEAILPYVSTYKYLRSAALYGHPNSLAIYAAVAISGLLFLRYKNKISLPEFFILFVPLLIFGFTTLSRNFYLVAAVALVIFAIMHTVKAKKNFWKLGISLFMAVVLCCGICLTETKIMLVRLKLLPQSSISEFLENSDVGPTKDENAESGGNSEYKKFSDEWWAAVYAGEIWYDPGRTEIAKIYLKAWRSSTKTMFFGKGINAPSIGKMMAHNMLIQELYYHGLVGMLFYLIFVLSILNFKGFKYWKKYLSMLVLLVPYFSMAMFESLNNEIIAFIFFVVAAGLIQNEIVKENNQVKKRVLFYNATLGFGGTDNYMVNLIENVNSEAFEFDVVYGWKDNYSQALEERLKNKNVKIHHLKGNKIFKYFNFTKLVNGGIYDVMHINATRRTTGIYAYIAKDFGEVKNVIFHSHMGGNDNKNNALDKLGIVLAKNFSDRLVSCSNTASEYMYGTRYCKKHNVLVLNNSINLDNFKYNKKVREEYRKQLNLNGKFVLLNIGRFAQQKNQLRLIEVFKAVAKKDKTATLVLIGNGPLEEQIVAKIKELKLENKVKILGSRNDVNKIMQAADVFVMTSIHEGLPIVAVETQTSGLPLVLSSSITKETDLTDNCAFVGLEEDNEKWADEILKFKTFKRSDTTKKIIQHNFDNKSACEIIESIY